MLENDHFEALAKERLANLTIGDRFSIGARYFKKGVRLM